MNREVFIQRLRKWEEELREFLAWAEAEADPALTGRLKALESSLSSLAAATPHKKGQVSESRPNSFSGGQDEFWPDESKPRGIRKMVDDKTKLHGVDKVVDLVIAKIDQLTLPKISDHARCRR